MAKKLFDSDNLDTLLGELTARCRIVTFAGFISEASSTFKSGSLATNPAKVFYNSTTNTFVGTPDTIDSTKPNLYTNWPGATKYGSTSATGIVPAKAALYINGATKLLYLRPDTNAVELYPLNLIPVDIKEIAEGFMDLHSKLGDIDTILDSIIG